MGRIIRLAALLVVLGGLATALVAYATAGPPNHANRLEATFAETVKVVHLHIADGYGIIFVILTGSGTVEGFGAATEVRGVSADQSVRVAGAASGASTLRIVTAGGTLAIFISEDVSVPTATGEVDTGTYEVNGLASTGVFAGATGSGTTTNLRRPGPHIFTLSGKLNLVNDEGNGNG